MVTIKDASRLLKWQILAATFMPKGLNITPLFSGTQGVGKTALCNNAVTSFGGTTSTVEGGGTKEGEMTGYPFIFKEENERPYLNFAMYNIFNEIARLEKYYYEKAKEGFKTNSVKLEADGSTTYELNGKKYVIPALTEKQKRTLADENKYKFGEELPPEVKLNLYESGEVTPSVILLDEINRMDPQTMKEAMNILLTKKVQEYVFPWWVTFVAAINPSTLNSEYNVNEIDKAQLDRFLKLQVIAKLDEWQDYAIGKKLNPAYVQAIDNTNFIQKVDLQDDEEPVPSPRSHEYCARLFDAFEYLKKNKNKFFTDEELKKAENDLAILIKGKLGVNAGSNIMSKLKNAARIVRGIDVVNGESANVSAELINKLKNSETYIQKFFASDLVSELSTNLGKYMYQKDKESVEKWKNIKSQLKIASSTLTPTISVMFAKELMKTNFNFDEKHHDEMFYPLADTFEDKIVDEILSLKKDFAKN